MTLDLYLPACTCGHVGPWTTRDRIGAWFDRHECGTP